MTTDPRIVRFDRIIDNYVNGNIKDASKLARRCTRQEVAQLIAYWIETNPGSRYAPINIVNIVERLLD